MQIQSPEPKKPTADWLRLQEVIRSTGMSVHAFALHIGLPRSENLYQIKKGNHGISKTLAETIHRFCPQFSVGWLLSGDPGLKILQESDRIELKNDTLVRIPVYGQIRTDAQPIFHRYFSQSLTNGAQCALINADGSLAPLIPVGAMVLVKPTEHLISGRFCLVVTPEYSLIRKVRATEDPDYIRLQAPDCPDYEDIVLRRSAIDSLYTVEKILADLW